VRTATLKTRCRGRLPSQQTERLCDRGEVVDVTVDGVQAEAHRDHREMGASCLTPGTDLSRHVGCAAGTNRHIVRAKVFDRPAEAFNAIS
jgi:hypothetical protein